ncbi:MAG: lysine--tRNA ligase [Clostridia bacterium]
MSQENHNTNQENEAVPEVDINELRQIRRAKLASLQAEGNNPFAQVKFEMTHSTAEILEQFETLEGQTVSIAGRIMSMRDMGKASFCHLQDREGQLQLYVKIDEIGELEYENFKKLDLGDIIGIAGEVFRTRRGEISVKVAHYILLAKSLQPLPEKFHGLKDMDIRYRQRYLDMIVNPEVKNNFIIRSKIIKAIRKFMDDRGFLEVETPLLNTKQGGAAAKPFTTHHNALDLDLFMRIAPELYLKRLIVGGLERVYEMGKNFRNEGISIKHNPEFTMMEVYQAYTDYQGMMELTETLISTVAQEVLGTTKVMYQGVEIELAPPWARISMNDAVKQYAGIDFSTFDSNEAALDAVKAKGVKVEGKPSKGELLNILFEEFAEDHLIQPTFVYDYPVEVSPLAKRRADNPDMTERFEVFTVIGEMGNAFSELNDPIDQMGRFAEQVKKREAGDDEAAEMDEDYIDALEIGLPPTGGLGIGIDRLVMLLTDSYSIRDVILFPTMKPKL